MKIEDLPVGPNVSFGGLLERIEILRTALRWPQSLDRTQINKLLNQCNALREEALRLSNTERFVRAAAAEAGKGGVAERRAGLMERDFQFDGVFGDSPKLIEAFEIAEKAAPTDLPILIDGESGTGKELMAKVIHSNGSRADRPYITVNCGAIPDELLESELFGHRKGSFTGATSDRSGKFESAHRGTIFLDEIGELPLKSQVKLLRVLQSNEIQRVGSDELIQVDARIVAATNKDLLAMCKAGTFREDLYYRLSIIQVTLPPLRERKDEIPLLIEYLTNEAASRLGRQPVKLSRRLRTFMQNYAYPGNIRELRNIVFRISCLAGVNADFEHLPENIRPGANDAAAASERTKPVAMTLSEAKAAATTAAERDFLETSFIKANGKVTALARNIGMTRPHVQTLLKKHGISKKKMERRRTPRQPA